MERLHNSVTLSLTQQEQPPNTHISTQNLAVARLLNDTPSSKLCYGLVLPCVV